MRHQPDPFYEFMGGLLVLALLIVAVAIGYLIMVRPKLEVCRRYYPELSTLTCIVTPIKLTPGGER